MQPKDDARELSRNEIAVCDYTSKVLVHMEYNDRWGDEFYLATPWTMEDLLGQRFVNKYTFSITRPMNVIVYDHQWECCFLTHKIDEEKRMPWDSPWKDGPIIWRTLDDGDITDEEPFEVPCLEHWEPWEMKSKAEKIGYLERVIAAMTLRDTPAREEGKGKRKCRVSMYQEKIKAAVEELTKLGVDRRQRLSLTNQALPEGEQAALF